MFAQSWKLLQCCITNWESASRNSLAFTRQVYYVQCMHSTDIYVYMWPFMPNHRIHPMGSRWMPMAIEWHASFLGVTKLAVKGTNWWKISIWWMVYLGDTLYVFRISKYYWRNKPFKMQIFFCILKGALVFLIWKSYKINANIFWPVRDASTINN